MQSNYLSYLHILPAKEVEIKMCVSIKLQEQMDVEYAFLCVFIFSSGLCV